MAVTTVIAKTFVKHFEIFKIILPLELEQIGPKSEKFTPQLEDNRHPTQIKKDGQDFSITPNRDFSITPNRGEAAAVLNRYLTSRLRELQLSADGKFFVPEFGGFPGRKFPRIPLCRIYL